MNDRGASVASLSDAARREIFGWQMYDWAWSAFSTTVTTALLGPSLLELAKDNGGVDIGVWTIAPAFRRLRPRLPGRRPVAGRRYPVTFRSLLAHLVFNDGILTVIAVATSFAADELGAEARTLLLLVWLIQFVAIPGAVGFGRLAERFGSKTSLQWNLVVWAGLVRRPTRSPDRSVRRSCP